MYKYKPRAHLRICVLVFLTYIISHTKAQGDLDLPCYSDNDCAKERYCYKYGYCVKCTNCAAYNKENVTCAQSPYDCGNCTKGYQYNPDDLRYDGKPPKYCVKIQAESTSEVAVISNHTTPASAVNTNTPSGTDHATASTRPAEPNIMQSTLNGTKSMPTPSNSWSVLDITIIVFAVTCLVIFIIFISFKIYGHAAANQYQRAKTNEPVESGNQNPTGPLIQSTDTISYANEVSLNENALDINSETEQPLNDNAPAQQSEIPSTDNSEVLNTATQLDSNDSTVTSNRPNLDNTDSCQNCSQNRQNQNETISKAQLTNINNTYNQQTTINQINNIIQFQLPRTHKNFQNNQNIYMQNTNKKLQAQENINNNQYYNKSNIEDESKCQWPVVKD